jgi:hypothetical protein
VPRSIRLIGLAANGAVGICFAYFTLFMFDDGRLLLAFFFALVAATAMFSSYVIRKSANVIALQAAREADLERQLAASILPPQQQGPPP